MISSAALLSAIVTALFFAAFGIVSRVLAVKSENPLAFAVVYSFFASIISVLALVVEPIGAFSISPFIIFITLLATIFYGVFEIVQFFARKLMEASRSAIIFQIAPAITFLVSIALLHEGAQPIKIVSVALIFAGNLLALWRHDGMISRKGFWLTAIGATGLGLAYVADKVASPHYPLGIYMLITYILPGLYVLLLFLITTKNPIPVLKNEFASGTWKIPLLAALSVGGYGSLLWTFRLAEASIAVPVAYTSSILTVLGGIIILRERSSILQKIAGAVFVFAGVLLLR